MATFLVVIGLLFTLILWGAIYTFFLAPDESEKDEDRLRKLLAPDESEKDEDRLRKDPKTLFREWIPSIVSNIASRCEADMLRLGLSCNRCDGLAIPILETEANYRCIDCGRQFTATVHKYKIDAMYSASLIVDQLDVYPDEGEFCQFVEEQLEAACQEAWSVAADHLKRS